MRALLNEIGLSSLIAIAATSSFTPRRLIVEPNHSVISFTVPISKGLTAIRGAFTSFSIDLEMPDADMRHARISATIDPRSIDTNMPGRDADLLTETFLDTTRFKSISFISDSISGAEPDYVAHGMFSMHGVVRRIDLPFRVTGRDGQNTIGFEAHTSIVRSHYEVGTSFRHTEEDGFIGDTIGVDIWFWTRAPRQ